MASEGGVLRELIAIFEVKADTSGLKKGESELSEFLDKVKKFGEALIAAFAVEQLYEFTEAQVKAMTSIKRTADQLGISTDAVQGFQFAAKSLGLDADALTNSMGRLQVVQNAALEGNEKAAESFSKIGVSIKDANGNLKSGDQLFNDVASGISKISDPAKQAGAAVALFGRNGRTLLPILKKGGEGVARLLDEYKELGGGYGQDAIDQAEKFEEQSAKVDLVLTNLKGVIAQQLMPVFLQAGKWLMQAVKWIKGLTENTTIFRVVLIGFIGVVGALAASLIVANLPLIIMAASFILLALLVDDLIELFTGGDSQIGVWIDQAFGAGQSVELVQNLKDAWDGLVTVFKEYMIPTLTTVWDIFKGILGIAGKVIGVAQKISGAAGDLAARLTNKAADLKDEAGPASDERAKSLHDNTVKQSANAYLAAQQQNGDQTSKYAGLNVQKGQTADDAIAERDAYLANMKQGNVAGSAFNPSVAGAGSAGGNSQSETKIEVNVTATPGTDGNAVGQQIAKPVKDAADDANREHMARLQRSGV